MKEGTQEDDIFEKLSQLYEEYAANIEAADKINLDPVNFYLFNQRLEVVYKSFLIALKKAIPDNENEFTKENFEALKSAMRHMTSFLEEFKKLPPEIAVVLKDQKQLKTLQEFSSKNAAILANLEFSSLLEEKESDKDVTFQLKPSHKVRQSFKPLSERKSLHFSKGTSFGNVEAGLLSHGKVLARKQEKHMLKSDLWTFAGIISVAFVITAPLAMICFRNKIKHSDKYDALLNESAEMSNVYRKILDTKKKLSKAGISEAELKDMKIQTTTEIHDKFNGLKETLKGMQQVLGVDDDKKEQKSKKK